MAKLKVTQVRSSIDYSFKQKRTLTALGIKKMNGSVIHEDSPSIRGMINKIPHLITVEEIEG